MSPVSQMTYSPTYTIRLASLSDPQRFLIASSDSSSKSQVRPHELYAAPPAALFDVYSRDSDDASDVVITRQWHSKYDALIDVFNIDRGTD